MARSGAAKVTLARACSVSLGRGSMRRTTEAFARSTALEVAEANKWDAVRHTVARRPDILFRLFSCRTSSKIVDEETRSGFLRCGFFCVCQFGEVIRRSKMAGKRWGLDRLMPPLIDDGDLVMGPRICLVCFLLRYHVSSSSLLHVTRYRDALLWQARFLPAFHSCLTDILLTIGNVGSAGHCRWQTFL